MGLWAPSFVVQDAKPWKAYRPRGFELCPRVLAVARRLLGPLHAVRTLDLTSQQPFEVVTEVIPISQIRTSRTEKFITCPQ